jgi:hypothetical protein
MPSRWEASTNVPVYQHICSFVIHRKSKRLPGLRPFKTILIYAGWVMLSHAWGQGAYAANEGRFGLSNYKVRMDNFSQYQK